MNQKNQKIRGSGKTWFLLSCHCESAYSGCGNLRDRFTFVRDDKKELSLRVSALGGRIHFLYRHCEKQGDEAIPDIFPLCEDSRETELHFVRNDKKLSLLTTEGSVAPLEGILDCCFIREIE